MSVSTSFEKRRNLQIEDEIIGIARNMLKSCVRLEHSTFRQMVRHITGEDIDFTELTANFGSSLYSHHGIFQLVAELQEPLSLSIVDTVTEQPIIMLKVDQVNAYALGVKSFHDKALKDLASVCSRTSYKQNVLFLVHSLIKQGFVLTQINELGASWSLQRGLVHITISVYPLAKLSEEMLS